MLGSLGLTTVLLAVVLGDLGVVIQVIGWVLAVTVALFGMQLLGWRQRRHKSPH